jgi:hypothetical protein
MANIFNPSAIQQIGAALSRSFLNKTGVITLSCTDEILVFPVVPSEFGVSVQNNNEAVNIVNAGDYAMLGKTGLKHITINSFFPAQRYNFSSGDADPYELVERIEKWRIGTMPLNISVEDSPINFDGLIDSFSYKEQDGSNDVYFSLSLIEYRHIIDMLEDKDTGLKSRQSTWQKIGNDVAVSISKGQPIMAAIKKAIKKSAKSSGSGYLVDYKRIIKNGGLSAGDILIMSTKGTSVNGKNIG